MSEDNRVAEQSIRLPRDTVVYRAVLNSKHVDENQNSVQFDLFMLRSFPDKDKPEEGISLTSSVEACIEKFKDRRKPLEYVVELTVAQIQDAGIEQSLDLYVEVSDRNPDHPQIMGLPCPRKEENKLQRIAGLLAKQCKIIKLDKNGK